MRIILLNVRGATSFEYLRRYNGTLYQTFIETGIAAELVGNDEEWENAMIEGCTYQMPRVLRQLFVVKCLFCQPANPMTLFD